MFDWNDLRHLIAVSRHGSTLAAAKALGVNQSTVHRRLAELERRAGLALVQRRPSGYRLSEIGETLIDNVLAVETAVSNLEHQVQALKNDLKGVIRLTCPEPTVSRIAASGLLDGFHERYPGLKVQFTTSDRYLDIAKGEADVAFRSGEPADENLVGRKICDSVWAIYASRNYVQQHGRPGSIAELADHDLIGFDGIAPLPTTLGDAEEALVQVLPPVEDLARSWYLLTTSDLRKTPRIAAFVDHVLENVPALRIALIG